MLCTPRKRCDGTFVGRYMAITSEILAVVVTVGALGRTAGPPLDGESIPMGVEDIVSSEFTKISGTRAEHKYI